MEAKAFRRKSQGKGYLTFEIAEPWQPLIRNKLFDIKFGDAVRLTIDRWSDSGTELQNRLFHKLISLYWRSGLSSANSKEGLKIYIKNTYGVPYKIESINSEDWKILKSWSKYTKKERMRTIDGLIDEMLLAGVDIDSEKLEWDAYKGGQ